jgi:hypothetical protein
VTSVNDAPQGSADRYSVLGAQALNVRAARGLLSNDADADGDPLVAVLVNGPANGTIKVRPNGSFQYSARPGFFGVDQFTYLPNDGTAGGSAVTVTIQVQPVPEPIVPGFPQVDVDSDGDMDQDDERLAMALVSHLTVEEPAAPEAAPQMAPPRRSSVQVPFPSGGGAAARGSLEPGDLPTRGEALHAWRLLTSADAATVEADLIEQGVRGQLSWFFDPSKLWSEVDSQDDPYARPTMLFRLGVTAVATTAISAGYIMWSIRGSYLLATLVSSLPAWHAIDPLPVLTAAASQDDSDDESLTELLEQANLDPKEA